MNQRKSKLMILHKALHPRDDADRLYVSKKREEENLPAAKTALMHRYNYLKLFFFPFLFPSYGHSVVHRLVYLVSDGCKRSTFVVFYVVLESLYRCVNAAFSAGKSSSSILS